MDSDNVSHNGSQKGCSTLKTIKVTMSVDSTLYKAFLHASIVCRRSLRSEVRVRVEDCLSRYYLITPDVNYSPLKESSRYITIELPDHLNANLNRFATAAGRSKETELLLRLKTHVNMYEIFITSELFKQK